ncbi:L7Ae/L30e/S12e/Gadd45 family ribosomal protein [Sporolituus thermophilus]|uniref:Large subunit ribosomal protein L7A n=1 Tax=Sporolituus thermophilus DSM 23256 TaxID=1123285 RepID=A0A1G7PFE7_9FIRM|nr:ribosomal L7Ae/L30e/S12e/Gadd45 family protein [Sporolituus thermophilus]SDF84938.1 large subunit ribosomal protein L7A [Sporolituus thermophilus DSM 23256]
MSLETLKKAKKVIGAKQTTRAIEKGTALRVYLATDADHRIVQPIRTLCAQKGVPVEEGLTMDELGQACGIEVGAAAVAIVS